MALDWGEPVILLFVRRCHAVVLPCVGAIAVDRGDRCGGNRDDSFLCDGGDSGVGTALDDMHLDLEHCRSRDRSHDPRYVLNTHDGRRGGCRIDEGYRRAMADCQPGARHECEEGCAALSGKALKIERGTQATLQEGLLVDSPTQ